MASMESTSSASTPRYIFNSIQNFCIFIPIKNNASKIRLMIMKIENV
ncbi:unnamed protein product [Spodoptera littoralis]|uniref:Uncharacterized protein n=1 Tax=Spodoptera littoralis TaxID=7109 RepID=A0A9P0MWS5_SPOLI|nr:unnamed protein product [Spodoptera littoralis]CAH1636243.1 unnamed protein product [Spodoptera littoralis]